MVRTVDLALALLLVATGQAAEAVPPKVPGQSYCTSSESQGAYQRCLEEQAKARVQVVQAAEELVLAAISSSKQEARYRQDARALFDASRQMFRAQRTAACEVAAAAPAGARGAAERRLMCQEQLDLEWIAHLEYLAESFRP